MASFCPKCGAGLADNARFCGGCGAQFQNAAPQQPQPQQPQPYAQPQYAQQPYQQPQYAQPQPQYAPPPAAAPPPVKKKGKGLAIGIGAAALVVVLIVVIAVAGKKDKPGNGGDNGGGGGIGSFFNQGGNEENGNNGNNSSGGDAFQYGSDYIAEKLKGDYSITYKYSVSGADGSDDAMTSKYIRTSDGYYMAYSGLEMLYIKDGDMYDTYMGSEAEGFTKMDFMDPISKEEVESNMGLVGGFMSQYSAWDKSDMKRDGSETIAGRKCEKYTYSASAFGSAVKYSYCIDKDTGVCLKYSFDVSAIGQGAGSMTFECTEFKTHGVSLPNYK